MDKKHEPGINRRDLLKVISTLPAAALVPFAEARGDQETPMPKPSAAPAGQEKPAGPYRPRVLTEREWHAVQVLSDLIIPADERSASATEAGVPEFIDDWLDLKGGKTLDAIRGGLTWLDLECNRQFGHDFVECSEAQQKQILDRIAYPKTAAPEDAAGVAFFNHLRDLVVSGFFSSKVGVADLPYVGNQMVAHWEGCPADVLEKIHKHEGKGKSA